METNKPLVGAGSVRNYGIDLLRMVSMCMVVMLHVLGFDNVLKASVKLSVNYEIAWFLEIAAYCAVNTFALISGYVSVGKKHGLSRLIELTAQVYFYVLISIVLYVATNPAFSVKGIASLLIHPFIRENYWYFAAYFCLFFFLPFLDRLAEKLSQAEYRRLLCALVLVFTVIPLVMRKDIPQTANGYSMLWLAVMYLVGGYFNRFGTPKGRNSKNLLYFFLMILVSWLFKFVIEVGVKLALGKTISANHFISYISPTIFFSAVFLFLFFEKLRVGANFAKVIKFFSPAAFGVLLLHLAPVVFERYIESSFGVYASFNPVLMTAAVIGTAIGIWLICSLVDRLRMLLFDVLKIKKLSQIMEDKLYAFCRFVYKKVFREQA